MKWLIPLALLFVFWTACSDSNTVPSGIIAKEKMEKVLWDIIQADQFSTNYLKKDSAKINVKFETMKLYDEVFLMHHVTREQFQKSYKFYLDHPDLTKVMFDSLSARASRERNEIYRRPIKPPTPVKPVTGKMPVP